MADLPGFLKHNIEGYLFSDIRKLQVSSPRADGVGYPLLMTVFSGIEFLGALLSPNTKAKAFDFYWRTHLYPSSPARASFGDPLYNLVRHGIAHSFLMKGHLGVQQRTPESHLHQDPTERFIIDAAELGDDFICSYKQTVRPLLDDPAHSRMRKDMEARLDKIEDHDKRAFEKYRSILAKAPKTSIISMVTTVAPGA
jgi:hypothetical protein